MQHSKKINNTKEVRLSRSMLTAIDFKPKGGSLLQMALKSNRHKINQNHQKIEDQTMNRKLDFVEEIAYMNSE